MPAQFTFKSSTRCTEGCGGACVEVALNVPSAVAVRDSKTGVVAEFSHPEWRSFIAGAKAGEFDI